MNRAWIPAGALAGVSVAGLLALGQVTDSLNTPVSFQSSVAVTVSAPKPSAAPVSLSGSVVGKTSTAALGGRGGQAGSPAPTSGESGRVAVQIHKTAPSTGSNSTVRATSTPTTSATAKKKPKRPTTITGVSSGSNNGDAGLAEGGTNSTSTHGGLTNTPSADTPAP
jgi:hypothetical protein